MKKIIHIDMDCFYAAVETRDNPKYRGIPLAVGGTPESRGVIATANYEARKYGVRSAMPSALAMKKCPHLTLIGGSSDKYKEASQIIREVFSEYTNLVEPLSLDEAYLDVTDCPQLQNSATLIAQEIRKKIFERTQLTASAGVAPNKFLAKVASDWNKANGMKVIAPQDVREFVKELEVEKINGVGKVTAEKLHKLGIKKCKDIQARGPEFMEECYGKFGRYLYNLSLGRDDREVVTYYPRKSLSVEETFATDIAEFHTWQKCLMELLDELNQRLHRFKTRKNPDVKIDKLTIKLKYYDFVQTTIQKKCDETFINDLWEKHIVTKDLQDFVLALLSQGHDKRRDPVRLIGIGVGFKHLQDDCDQPQLSLFEVA